MSLAACLPSPTLPMTGWPWPPGDSAASSRSASALSGWNTRPARAISLREGYCERLRRILAEQFPDESLEKISVAPDLEHSLSKLYTRGILRRGWAHAAFLAVAEGESHDALQSSLTHGLLWLEKSRQAAKRAALATLPLILPKGKSSVLANRLRGLDERLAVEVFQLDPQRAIERQLAEFSQPARQQRPPRALSRADRALDAGSGASGRKPP